MTDNAAREWRAEWRERSDMLTETFDAPQQQAEADTAIALIGEDVRRVRRAVETIRWLLLCALVGIVAAALLT